MNKFIMAVSIGVAAGTLGCHQATQQTALAPQPTPDSLAAQRARQDSLDLARQRAHAERDSLAARRRTDSLATLRVQAAAATAELATMLHFDFDRATLRPGDTQLLDQKIPILHANPTVRIQIAGNCDERGSDEYNLALGNRRAITARAYLVNHGIPSSRIETVSYGKERPIDPAHNPEAWAKDRNDQFIDLNTSVGPRQP
jgi:peptidoglycan-associated lipoprotein